MAPPPLPLRHYTPSHVTEDTPPDLLEGTMDLAVTLPNEKMVVMNVHRSTPMMDLLIQVTTAHHINPGGHVIQVVSDNIFLSYKPSTPIGTLDTNAIKVVAKNKINEMAKLRKMNLQQQAMERNIRLKPKEWVYKQQLVVNLPHNQLAVYRVPPKALISDIFTMICEDKNLDSETHEMRHPVNVDERLRGSCSLADYQLQEVCVVSSDFRPPPLSVTDLITMSSISHPEDKRRRGFLGLFSRKTKSSTGDSSVSSGSAGERSVSPARSDESTEGRPTPQALSPASSSGTLTNVNCSSAARDTTNRTSVSLHNSTTNIHSNSTRMSRPVSMVSLNRSRKRPAPVPPQRQRCSQDEIDQQHRDTPSNAQVNGKVKSTKAKPSLSRHSSDSSGYHESDVKSSQTSPSSSEVSSLEVSRQSVPSAANQSTTSNSFLSVSSSKGKRKAPSPPKAPLKNGGPLAIPECPEEIDCDQKAFNKISNSSISNEDGQKDSNSSATSSSSNSSSPVLANADKARSSDVSIKEDGGENVTGEEEGTEAKTDNKEERISEELGKENKIEDEETPEKARLSSFGSQSDPDQSRLQITTEFDTVEKDSCDQTTSITTNITTTTTTSITATNCLDTTNTSSSVDSDNTHNEAHAIDPVVQPSSPVDKPVAEPSTSKPEEEGLSSPSPQIPSAEDEVHPRTVSLSSETSGTSVEMLNPKDIQRPKRQKRKRIPEVFMRSSSSLKDSPSSSEYRKSIERVDEVIGKEIEAEVVAQANHTQIESNDIPRQVEKDVISEQTVTLNQCKPVIKDLESCTLNETYNDGVATELSNPSVLYVEMIHEEESTTDPVPPAGDSKQNHTSKVQKSDPPNEESAKERRETSVTALVFPSSFPETSKSESCKDDVIAELKSAIEGTSDDDHSPRILNLKPKGKDWTDSARTNSDYNVILSFGNGNSSHKKIAGLSSLNSSSSTEQKSITRSSSTTSHDSIENTGSAGLGRGAGPTVSTTAVRESRSSTESSYESAPPPLPESSLPILSDSSSKASSATVSRQSSFSDADSHGSHPHHEFVKPRVPGFSISTYKSRASKVSYDKKLSRSESLSSVKDLHHGENADEGRRKEGDKEEEQRSDCGSGRKLFRSDSQRNEVFRSDDLKKKSTSTTFLNSPFGEWSELKNNNCSSTTVRPSFKSHSRNSLFEGNTNDATSKRSQDGSIQFELNSAKDSAVLPQPAYKTYTNLRKTKSTVDIRAPEGTMNEGYQAIPDSGLANEYMRLQDDFMKWQHQLLQNQQILHNRVAPIAANPPTLNNAGRSRGLRLGWKTATPWMVNNMVNQKPPNAPPQQQARKPIEITIPIRLEDDDADSREAQVLQARQAKETIQSPKVVQTNQPGPTPWKKGPNVPSVPIGAWQERPAASKIQPEVPERTHSQTPDASFGKPPGMQTFPQTAPQGRQPPSSPYQQVTPQNFQQRPQPQGFQQVPRSGFQQVPQSTFQQVPQSTFQQVPQSTFQQVPQSTYQQVPQSNYQQMPQSNYQQMPQSNYQQVPQSNYQQVPQSNYQQVPQSNYQQVPQSNYQQVPQSNYQQVPQSSFKPATAQPNSQFNTRNHTQPPSAQYGPKTQTSPNNDENINARFSSVVTLNNDKGDHNSAPPKDKVRSVVQLNNAVEVIPQVCQLTPFQSSATEEPVAENEPRSPPFNAPSSGFSGTPMSSRLVQQAVQQPLARCKVSPPKIQRLPSPPKIERQPSPPKVERQPSPPKVERQPSPPKVVRQATPPEHEPSPPPFAGVKLRPVETRVSPPKSALPQPPSPPSDFGPPLPPPPPPPPMSKIPPPPPPPGMNDEDRRTSTGKKIISSTNAPAELDARQELMMAIRQFGGAGNLKRGGHPPPGCQFGS